MRKRGTELQFKIIDLLVEGMSRKEIADKLGCSLVTIDTTKADPDLKRRYLEKCNEQISDLVPLAIQRLHKLIRNDKTQASVQVAAIKEVLDRSHLRELINVEAPEIKVTVSYE